jgi:hypothetical protein
MAAAPVGGSFSLERAAREHDASSPRERGRGSSSSSDGAAISRGAPCAGQTREPKPTVCELSGMVEIAALQQLAGAHRR